jgi:3-deoxy-7-phosphoheptulonate synthase
MSALENRNIKSYEKLVTPEALSNSIPTTNAAAALVRKTREEIRRIICGDSSRMLLVVGPCSIHNTKEAMDYGRALKKLADVVESRILIVMRVYFEKPRTTVGWKGLINDPDLNGTCRVNEGLRLARKLLLDLNNIGLPCGYEVLDTITPQYISDLMSWGAVGARTVESQVHRQLVSGLSMPIGFKNGTSGSLSVAADAILSARHPHCFMGITQTGEPAICNTAGNEACHIILRGGRDGPNYTSPYIDKAMLALMTRRLNPCCMMVDCSHGNSGKDHKKQHIVFEHVIAQRTGGNHYIVGLMLESNINAGKQEFTEDVTKRQSNLKYGFSITDACIDIEETNRLVRWAYGRLT